MIVVRLDGSSLPSKDPKDYKEDELVTYDEAKESSRLKPYVAVILDKEKVNKLQFTVGDDSSSSLSEVLKRTRRAAGTDVVYQNGPLEAGKTYSVFQRSYENEVKSLVIPPSPGGVLIINRVL